MSIAAGILAGVATAFLFWITEHAFKAATEEATMRDRVRVIGPDRRTHFREPAELLWKREGWRAFHE